MPAQYSDSPTARFVVRTLQVEYPDGATIAQLHDVIGGHEQSVRQNVKLLLSEGTIDCRLDATGRRRQGFIPRTYFLAAAGDRK